MKISIKTLGGSSFEIDVDPSNKVADLKKLIESTQGVNVYPADQQMLIHQGNVLKNETTLEENKVLENNFIVIMLSKKGSSSAVSASTKEPTSQTAAGGVTSASPATQPPAAPAAVAHVSEPASTAPAPLAVSTEVDPYGQAASNLDAVENLESTIQSMLEMGGGAWTRAMVIYALQATFNNQEQAVDYLCYGVLNYEQETAASVAAAAAAAAGRGAIPPARVQPVNPIQAPQSTQPAVPLSGPNANPLNLFPQGLPNASSNAGGGNLEVLRNNPQFQGLLSLVQANPQILQPLLQELGKQNPQILQLIQENQDEFLRLINEPADGDEGDLRDLPDQFGAAGIPQTVAVTPKENEAIQRLEQMGFDHDLVLEVFFACNKDEQLAANYLLDHGNEFDDEAPQ